ncbi:hypothetical protein [Pseudomonas multiresinivorans]|uniref:Uncharacterized protein n=1 Tax=Pseudomonas multiresinivorans TaxID=95301 RepID=A0A7Z3GRC8_9PSED|nr:hypothetical protein [Pseudomonas multiresinivorans]QJP09035.1 hypothetical protein G4G71_14545 [Pseudomonas multiresinivorans]
MTISCETIFKLTNAVEALVITGGSAIERAKLALHSLRGIKKEDFGGDIAAIPWNYIASVSKDIESGRADHQVAEKVISSIWQLFDAFRPRS